MKTQELPHTRKQQQLDYDLAIGQALATMREREGKSQNDIAISLGCRQSLISKMEAGQRSIKLREIPLLASALEVSPQELESILLTVVADGQEAPRRKRAARP